MLYARWMVILDDHNIKNDKTSETYSTASEWPPVVYAISHWEPLHNQMGSVAKAINWWCRDLIVSTLRHVRFMLLLDSQANQQPPAK